MKRTVLLLPLVLLSSCQNPLVKMEDVVSTYVIVRATNDYQLNYFSIKTYLLKGLDEPQEYCYQSDYIGYDDYHVYYKYTYLTAVRDNEVLQIVEVNK